jgi:hypothetical protein
MREMTLLKVTGDARGTRSESKASMAIRNPWGKTRATFRKVLCGLLPLLVLPAGRAQSSADATLLNGWRNGFNRRLDDDLGNLASPPRSGTIDIALRERDTQNFLSQQTEIHPGLTYDGTKPWPSTVRTILQSQGLPTSLLGVVAIESGFNPAAVSTKGAAGLWQFMPATARQYGLVVNARQDDRFDIVKSTLAAAHYLRQLHNQFGDWPLALAAYNAGPNRVWQDMHRFNGVSFWTPLQDFLLPDETRVYVPKVLTWMRNDADHSAKLPRSADDVQSDQATKLLPMRQQLVEKVVFATLEPDLSGSASSK